LKRAHSEPPPPNTAAHVRLAAVMPEAVRFTLTVRPDVVREGDITASAAASSSPRRPLGLATGRMSADRICFRASGAYQSGVELTVSSRRKCVPLALVMVTSAVATILVQTVKGVLPGWVPW
jgi:hypothetical protein